MSTQGLTHISNFLTPEYRFVTKLGPKLKVSLSHFSKSLTQQHFKDESDINVLMSRYQQTGILEGRDPATARYIDVTEFQSLDFQSAQNLIRSAHEQFLMLPSSLRSFFSNDPGKFLAFMEDPANAQEAIKMGLARDPLTPASTVPLGTANPSVSSAVKLPDSSAT